MKNDNLREFIDNMIEAYATRDWAVPFSEWFSEKMHQLMPDISAESVENLAGEIIAGIAGYDQRLRTLNDTIGKGASKEEWFEEKISEICEGAELQEAGEKLQEFENCLKDNNAWLLGSEKMQSASMTDEWTHRNVRQKAYDIVEQISVLGLAAAANALDRNMNYNAGKTETYLNMDTISESEEKKAELKAVMAGTVKAAVEQGMTDVLPADIPTEIICDLSGTAVETAEVFFEAARGSIKMREAMDKAGRAGTAMACRAGAVYLKGYITQIPGFGPILTDLLGGLFKHMESPKFFDNVYNTIHDAAIATWEGIKQKVGKIFHRKYRPLTEFQREIYEEAD